MTTFWSFSQEERTVIFGEQERTYILNFDNPVKLYDWNVSLSTMIFAVSQVELGLFLDADVKLNEKVRFSGLVAKSLRTNVSNTSTLFSHDAFEIFPQIHFNYYSRTPLRETKLILSRRYNTLYYVKTDVAKHHAFDLDLGLNYLFHYNPTFYRKDSLESNDSDTQFDRYYLLSSNTLGVTFGTSLSMTQHVNYLNIDGQLADRILIHRFSAIVILSGVIAKKFAMRDPDNELTFFGADDRFEQLYLPLGFRIGYQIQGSTLLIPKYYTFLGIDIGANPSYKYNEFRSNKLFGEIFYFNFRAGIGFCKLTN